MSVPLEMDTVAKLIPGGAQSYPLNEFYALAGRTLPAIELISGDKVPEPYRTLLVHHNDMTPTLEGFHRDKLWLRVLSRCHRDDFYFREVVLLTERERKPVEFGAIKIDLRLFPCAARPRILEELQPLGSVLRDYQVPHSSRPKAFLRVESDHFINQALGLAGRPVLYGRRNTLFAADQRPLAEIVEILPPVTS